jgi:ribosomal protein L32
MVVLDDSRRVHYKLSEVQLQERRQTGGSGSHHHLHLRYYAIYLINVYI